MWVWHVRKKVNDNVNAGCLNSYKLPTNFVYQFCCRCSGAKNGAKQV